ncbi:type II CAAX prenyl endopeptidase Rce1 family protein [Cognatiyoonia sp. IB215182]|uniref:CPBP family glutamic-type intramembrane protease n=1 Tax=Cognatiyoonia sp. IB215182 TaxID=3097353 RepID=UPI002A0C00F9|nr:CPBP family glutamic-type intramembrane protease [Cognatiyoonia sp. IB215182]MDX8351734.1 CPBP family glutamic-type intramembrane protease [Cognatiyoonia sp. IB215182]
MDRAAAGAVAAAIPVLAIVFYLATRAMPPLAGYLFGLTVYWFVVLTPLILWRGGFSAVRYDLVWPHPGLVMLNVLPICGVAVAAFIGWHNHPLNAAVLGAVVASALINGTLEEVFWRGTLLRNAQQLGSYLLQIALFVSWHTALLFAGGVVVTGGALGLLGGALIGGILWTWARVQIGSIGFGILCHIGLNLFAFTELATNNPI